FELLDLCHRAETGGALGAREGGEVDFGIIDALADPSILDRSSAHAGDPLLMKLVIEEGLVVRDDQKQRDAVMHGGPQRGDAHEVVAISTNSDRQPPGAAQSECGADRNARAAADAAAAIGPDKFERMSKWPARAVPRKRQMREGEWVVADCTPHRVGKIVDRDRATCRRRRSDDR